MHYSYLCYYEDSLEPEWRWKTYDYNSGIVNQVLATLASEHSGEILYLPSVYESAIPGHFERDIMIASIHFEFDNPRRALHKPASHSA